MEKQPIIIAIDGFSSSGKSTMARRLASAIGYRYIDSGAMYRAVALFALEAGMIGPDGTPDIEAIEAALPHIKIDFEPLADGTQHTILNGVDVESEIRRLRVSNAVSPVAAIPAVRHALVAMQKEMGKTKGIVMDGRDIGTVVFPRGRTQNIRRCFGRNPSTASIQRNDRKRRCRDFRGSPRQCRSPRPYRHYPRRKPRSVVPTTLSQSTTPT